MKRIIFCALAISVASASAAAAPPEFFAAAIKSDYAK